MSTIRGFVVAAALLMAPLAAAKAPAGQGRACDKANKCPAPLTCVSGRDARWTCQLVCAEGTKCPDDQRCVKDGAQSVCRPINDAVGL